MYRTISSQWSFATTSLNSQSMYSYHIIVNAQDLRRGHSFFMYEHKTN